MISDWRLQGLAAAVGARLDGWRAEGAPHRIWERDPGFWEGTDPRSVRDRLGWLDVPPPNAPIVAEVVSFAEEVRREGVDSAVLVGMGGSALAPHVLVPTLLETVKTQLADVCVQFAMLPKLSVP